jgi:Zn-dependent protease with chaperone function
VKKLLISRRRSGALLALLLVTAPGTADPVPESAALAALLQREHLTMATWPAWRERLRDWSSEPRDRTDVAFKAAREFIKSQLDSRGKLPKPLEKDALAWMLLGEAYLSDAAADPSPYARAQDAEKALRQSLRFDNRFARAHLDMALAQRQQGWPLRNGTAKPDVGKLRESFRHYNEALKLDPNLPALTPREAGELAMFAEDFTAAEPLLTRALQDNPNDAGLARSLARAVSLMGSYPTGRAATLRPLVERFPNDGILASLNALALGKDNDWLAADQEFARARKLGTDPATVVDPGSIRKAEETTRSTEQKASRDKASKEAAEHAAARREADKLESAKRDAARREATAKEATEREAAKKEAAKREASEREAAKRQAADQAVAARNRPGWLTYILTAFIVFFVFYASVMVLMATGGLLLAYFTRGAGALELLDKPPEQLVDRGKVARTIHESWLTRVYCFFLGLALLLFYVALPFVIWGLILLTLVVVFAGYFLRRDYHSAQLHNNMVQAGGGGVVAVFRAMFARLGGDNSGILKDAVDCPRLYQALEEVARRVDTEPIADVYIVPGASIGVHQEGRGPFGVLGVKRRVLTLGLSTLHFLTVSELKSILAHEYAHFSHADTFWIRFIHQVTASIAIATRGMLETGGWLTFLNPFYWFFYLYQKSYALLSSGFSRSREFLADRMACTLYGSDVFASALEKVCTDGLLFERTIYGNIRDRLDDGKAYVNMYVAFRKFREDKEGALARDQQYKKLLREQESLFDSHPTLADRVKAAAELPRADKPDTASAMSLFESPVEVEKELTDYLTAIMNAAYRMRRRR